MVQLLQSYVDNVYSIELPAHGQNRVEAAVPCDVAAEAIYAVVAPLVAGKSVFLFGYSVSSIFLMKLWPRLLAAGMRADSIAVFAAPGISSVEGWRAIDRFWRVEQFVQSNKSEVMTKMHGPGWQHMIRSVNLWSSPDNPYFLTADEQKALFCSPEARVYLVLADNDVAFSVSSSLANVDVLAAARKTAIVPGTHFNLFSSSWPYVDSAARLFARASGFERLAPQANL